MLPQLLTLLIQCETTERTNLQFNGTAAPAAVASLEPIKSAASNVEWINCAFGFETSSEFIIISDVAEWRKSHRWPWHFSCMIYVLRMIASGPRTQSAQHYGLFSRFHRHNQSTSLSAEKMFSASRNLFLRFSARNSRPDLRKKSSLSAVFLLKWLQRVDNFMTFLVDAFQNPLKAPRPAASRQRQVLLFQFVRGSNFYICRDVSADARL